MQKPRKLGRAWPVAGLVLWAATSAVVEGAEKAPREAPTWVKEAAGAAASASNAKAGGALSPETISTGLKRGLGAGVERAVTELGREDGFFRSEKFKVPLPAELAKGEKLLRKAGQGAMADELVLSLNRAAEKAVGETGPIFRKAIEDMTLSDARAILDGPPDAATRYFRRTTEDVLRAKMMPVVTAATEASGVGAAYKRFAGRAAPVSGLLGAKSLDLDSYVCDRALDGLFSVIATQEAQLRANPAGAADELLKKVFAAAKKP